MEKLKIEQGVPLPPERHSRIWLRDALLALEVGESFIVEDKTIRTHLSPYWKRMAPKRFTSRLVNGELRVWRTA